MAKVLAIAPRLRSAEGRSGEALSGNQWVAGAGANLLPVVHVDDLAAAYTLALTQAPSGTVLNVAATAVTGRDLARAISLAAGLGGEMVVRSPAEILSALGPLAGALMMDLRLSNFWVTQQLGWTPSAPSVLYELLHGTLKSPESGGAASPSRD